MKKLAVTILLGLAAFNANAQDRNQKTSEKDDNQKAKIVEASCGQCKFGLKGKGCDLAVRFDNKAYFVDGTNINSHGDAHAEEGFCNAIRTAKVQGEVKGDRFLVSSFVLLPKDAKEKENKN